MFPTTRKNRRGLMAAIGAATAALALAVGLGATAHAGTQVGANGGTVDTAAGETASGAPEARTLAAPTWPTPTGNAPVSNGTIKVTGTLDGGMKRYCCIGDGGQGESQDAVFELAPGATIENVILGAPAGDGIHCLGNCTIRNVWWEDVGEDAATFLGGSNYYVIGGGSRKASDKVFQHNGPGTLHISGFFADGAGKLYRACGNCSSSHTRHVVIDNVTVTAVKSIAGININWNDTARLSRITVLNDASRKTVVCEKYHGVAKGSEPTKVGSGADGKNCLYSESDISYQ